MIVLRRRTPGCSRTAHSNADRRTPFITIGTEHVLGAHQAAIEQRQAGTAMKMTNRVETMSIQRRRPCSPRQPTAGGQQRRVAASPRSRPLRRRRRRSQAEFRPSNCLPDRGRPHRQSARLQTFFPHPLFVPLLARPRRFRQCGYARLFRSNYKDLPSPIFPGAGADSRSPRSPPELILANGGLDRRRAGKSTTYSAPR